MNILQKYTKQDGAQHDLPIEQLASPWDITDKYCFIFALYYHLGFILLVFVRVRGGEHLYTKSSGKFQELLNYQNYHSPQPKSSFETFLQVFISTTLQTNTFLSLYHTHIKIYFIGQQHDLIVTHRSINGANILHIRILLL